MPITFTSSLPDEDEPSLGNGVEDEIAVDRESAASNYGDVRIQIRETGASTWDSSAEGFGEFIGAFDTLSMEFVGREDGERYEVRSRVETEHVTGDWTEPVAITTVFPGATQLVVTSAGQTSVDLEFEDNADNEDGVWFERREQFRSGWGEWRRLEDLGPNAGTGTVTTTDESVLPDTTYEYRVIPYTEHSSATSDAAETTTADDGVRTDRVPAQGWHVIVEDPDGNIFEPDVVGTPQLNGRLLDKPTAEIPVQRSDRWSDEQTWEGAPMRVYHDGQRQPIEELRRPRQETDRSVLVGVGGVDLEQRVTVDVIEEAAHQTADGVIADATGYERHVDDPAGDPSANVLQEDVDDAPEWSGAVDVPDDQPWEISDSGELRSLQTAGFYEAEGDDVTALSTEGELGTPNTDTHSGGAMQRIEAYERNQQLSGFVIDFETAHDIPMSAIGIAARIHYTGDIESHPSDAIHHVFRGEIDGTEIGVVGEVGNVGNDAQEWFLTTGDGLDGTLEAGQHTLEIRASEEADDGYNPASNWDCIAWFDDRFDPGFTETVVDDVIEGPDEHPEVSVETNDVVSVQQIVGGRLEITSGMDAAELELSNDNGVTWPVSATDTDSVEGEFASGSDTLRARLTLTGHDSDPTTSPAGRTAPQAVDAYQLFADLDDTPLLVNRSFSGSAQSILTDIADYSNALWEATWDETAGEIAIEWTQPGQRTADVDPDLIDYSHEIDYGSVYRKAIIKGTLVPGEEGVVADHGAWTDLSEDWLGETGEQVTSEADGTEYERGVDYELHPNAGEIQTLSTGEIDDSEDLLIDYRHHIVGEYESPDFDGTYPVLEETLPNVTTERNAEQAALIAVRVASEPIHRATATVGELPPDVHLVDALDLDQLPGDRDLEQWSVDNSPGETTIQLGSRDPVEETLNRLNSRLAAVSGKV